MGARIVSLFLTAMLCVCSTGLCRDAMLYQFSGRQKPIVVVLPVIDNTEGEGNEFVWELSTELTDEIRKRVFDSKRIYLLREGGSLEIANALNTPNPQAISNEATSNLGAAEYVVVTEIIEQEETPYGNKHSGLQNPIHSHAGAVLSLALRLRVLDVRHETPKIILQEVLDKDYVVACAYMNCDYDKMRWGTEAFNRTPMGMAHHRLVRELVSRVEAYIEASR